MTDDIKFPEGEDPAELGKHITPEPDDAAGVHPDDAPLPPGPRTPA